MHIQSELPRHFLPSHFIGKIIRPPVYERRNHEEKYNLTGIKGSDRICKGQRRNQKAQLIKSHSGMASGQVSTSFEEASNEIAEESPKGQGKCKEKCSAK